MMDEPIEIIPRTIAISNLEHPRIEYNSFCQYISNILSDSNASQLEKSDNTLKCFGVPRIKITQYILLQVRVQQSRIDNAPQFPAGHTPLWPDNFRPS
jgi:hypothetical protein